MRLCSWSLVMGHLITGVLLIFYRLKLPFLVDTYEPYCGYLVHSPVDTGLLTSDPMLSMLRVHYHVALSGNVSELLKTCDSEQMQSAGDEKLCIPPHDIKSLKCLQLRVWFDDLAALTSHQEVIKAIQVATVVAVTSSQVHTSLGFNNWTSALEK